MLLTGIALCVAGLAFKASVAPFHQWTPDVYEGAPTPITAFMAVATKVAALGVLLRLFDVALIEAHGSWGPALAALATMTILVGNVGALGQSSLKRMLAYSSVAQAGYMLAGVVVATRLGAQAMVFYLAVYLAMNMAAFAVIVARERETGLGDDTEALAGLGRERPWLAWPMTISMLALAGIPATAGFIGKFYLIDAAVAGGYTWLGVVIVIGSMISLGYYLPVIAAMWMAGAAAAAATAPAIPTSGRIPVIAGGRTRARRTRRARRDRPPTRQPSSWRSLREQPRSCSASSPNPSSTSCTGWAARWACSELRREHVAVLTLLLQTSDVRLTRATETIAEAARKELPTWLRGGETEQRKENQMKLKRLPYAIAAVACLAVGALAGITGGSAATTNNQGPSREHPSEAAGTDTAARWLTAPRCIL